MQVGGCNRTVWSLQYRSGWGPPPVESHTRRGQAIRAVIKKNLNIPVMSIIGWIAHLGGAHALPSLHVTSQAHENEREPEDE
eukprot:9450346-Pyramimonas_sp.AAC.1